MAANSPQSFNSDFENPLMLAGRSTNEVILITLENITVQWFKLLSNPETAGNLPLLENFQRNYVQLITDPEMRRKVKGFFEGSLKTINEDADMGDEEKSKLKQTLFSINLGNVNNFKNQFLVKSTINIAVPFGQDLTEEDCDEHIKELTLMADEVDDDN